MMTGGTRPSSRGSTSALSMARSTARSHSASPLAFKTLLPRMRPSGASVTWTSAVGLALLPAPVVESAPQATARLS